jgi:hypothetical protein
VSFLPLLLKYWRYAAGALLLAAVWFAIHHYGHTRYVAGKAEMKALWVKDNAARDRADADRVAADLKHQADNQQSNERRLDDANKDLVAIAGERDGVERLLNNARNQIRSLAASEATSQLGTAIATGIAARAAEVDRRLADYDSACRRDAVRFTALQDQIRGQL